MLHLDASDAYGGAWGVLADAAPHGSGWRLPRDPPASDDAEKVASDAPRENHGEETPPSTPTPTLPLPARGAPVASSTYRGFSALDLSADDDALLAALGGTRRPYALDLAAPKLVYCADGVVDALVASGAHNYCEFKALERTKVWWDGALRDVPASRAEVFRDRGLPPGDKRALMRLLKATWTAAVGGCVEVGTGDPDDVNVAMGAPGSEWGAGGGGGGADVGDGGGAEGGAASALYDGDGDGESFEACLAGARHRLSPKLTALVAYALALCDARDATAREGFARLTRYLASLGRFGPAAGALLTPNYGVGEFSQARSVLFLTPVPVRPRSRGARDSLRTFGSLPRAFLSAQGPSLGFNGRHTSTPFNSASDAPFNERLPDVASYRKRPSGVLPRRRRRRRYVRAPRAGEARRDGRRSRRRGDTRRHRRRHRGRAAAEVQGVRRVRSGVAGGGGGRIEFEI